jgi:hypothetical protein
MPSRSLRPFWSRVAALENKEARTVVWASNEPASARKGDKETIESGNIYRRRYLQRKS